MEKLANKIAELIAVHLSHDQEKTAVIAYGLAAIFQMVTILTVTLIIGIIGGFWPECIVIFFSVGLLRKSTGGAHSQAFIGCLFISIFTISFMAFLARYLFCEGNVIAFSVFYAMIFLLAFYVAYRKVPVDSPNKPITKQAKISRLRRSTFLTLSIYLAVTILLIYFSPQNPRLQNLATSLSFATLWQTFMLTEPGAKLIGIIDRKFQYD